MNELTLFEIASRENFTFDSARGTLVVHDLWALDLLNTKRPCLNGLAVVLSEALDQVGTRSFVAQSSTDPQRLALQQRLDVVLRIIEIKQAENSQALSSKKKADRRARLLEALDEKNEESIRNLSADELRAELSAL